jgi:hypothetical protein
MTTLTIVSADDNGLPLAFRCKRQLAGTGEQPAQPESYQ